MNGYGRRYRFWRCYGHFFLGLPSDLPFILSSFHFGQAQVEQIHQIHPNHHDERYKKLLDILAIFNGYIFFPVNSICLCLILFSSLMDESWRCKVTATTCAFLITGTFTMTNLISILRYYMAILSSKAKIAQGKVVIPFIIFWSLFCHGFFPCLILIQEYLGFESAISRCEGTLGKSKNSILFILWLIFLIGMTLIGLYCDKSLYDFVKKQHQIPKNEPRLVAWKSTNFTVQEDLQVPIRATAMSTFLIVLSTLFVILALNHNKDWVNFIS